MRTLFVILLALISVTGKGLAQDSISGNMLVRADSLYEHYHDREALELYEQILDQRPELYKALWQTSILYARVGHRLENEDRQQEYYNRGIELAERALSIDSTDTQSNFAMAVAMGRKAMISGPRERVAASRAIKRYAERTVRLDSTHAGGWHLLGRWHFKVANLNFLERAAANTLFGGIPEASENRAVRFLQRAIELNPQYILYYYDLATFYKHKERQKQAIEMCRRALELEPLAPEDHERQQNCRTLIDNLQ